MRQINLLPPRLREAQKTRALVVSTLVGLILGAGLAGIAWTSLKLSVSNLDNRASMAVSPTPTEGTQLPANLALRVSQLNTLSKSEVEWRKAFALVGSIVPQDIRLTSYSYAVTPGAVSLKFGGTAPSNLSFANFMQSLKGNTSLTDTKADSYTYDPASGTVSFSISSTVPLDKIIYQPAT